MKKVIVSAINGAIFTKALNADGSAKLDKNGKEHGFIRVQNEDTIDLSYAYNNGGLKKGNSALVAMTCEAWEKVKHAYKVGMEIPGQVIVKESLTKEHNGYQVKRAGGEGAPTCKVNGQDIYRTTEFTPKQDAVDTLIQHDNLEEIKAYQAANKVAATVVEPSTEA